MDPIDKSQADSSQSQPGSESDAQFTVSPARRIRVKLKMDLAPGQKIRVVLNAARSNLDTPGNMAASPVTVQVESNLANPRVVVEASADSGGGLSPASFAAVETLPAGSSALVEQETPVDIAASPEMLAPLVVLEPLPAGSPVLMEQGTQADNPASPELPGLGDELTSHAGKNLPRPGWPNWFRQFQSSTRWRSWQAGTVLFSAGVLLYLITHLVGLAGFPIYYTADESSVTVYGSDLIANGLRDNYGELLPTFFNHDNRYNLGVLVYIMAVVSLLVGKSVFFSRMVIVLASLAGAVWVSLILRDIFKIRWWWLGILVLAATPAWFVLSRGVYDVVLSASFFAGFVYYYSLYRYRSPAYIYAAVVFGFLTFYSYTSSMISIPIFGLLLVIFDFRYHWQQRIRALPALGLLVGLSLPMVRFLIAHPNEYLGRVAMYGSILGADVPIWQKVLGYVGNYLSVLNPFYWFFPNSTDQIMYIMKGYGHVFWPLLPFALLGLGQVLKNIRTAPYRMLLLALITVPIAPAMVTLTVYRALWMIILLALLVVLGFSWAVDWLQVRAGRIGILAAYAAPVLLGLLSVWMLTDALVHGPTWYSNYGISGLQYGAPQVYSAARSYVKSNPDVRVHVSPTWTFQGDIQRRFFVPEVKQIIVGSADEYLNKVTPGLENQLFILTPADYQKVLDSTWLETPRVELTIPYPNGLSGFYFVRLKYKANVDELVRSSVEKLHHLLETSLVVNGESWLVRYSSLDSGDVRNVFDGNPDTLIKTSGANPLVVEVEFPAGRQLTSVTARVGSEAVELTVRIDAEDGAGEKRYTQAAGGGNQPYKNVRVELGGVQTVKKLRFELLDPLAPEPSIVHLWGLSFQ